MSGQPLEPPLVLLATLPASPAPPPEPSGCELVPPKTGFRDPLAPKKKLKVDYTVAITCPNDPLPSSKTEDHADYRYTVALDSATDIQPTNDVCPRAPSGTENGCARGTPVRTDVIVK